MIYLVSVDNSSPPRLPLFGQPSTIDNPAILTVTRESTQADSTRTLVHTTIITNEHDRVKTNKLGQWASNNLISFQLNLLTIVDKAPELFVEIID